MFHFTISSFVNESFSFEGNFFIDFQVQGFISLSVEMILFFSPFFCENYRSFRIIPFEISQMSDSV